MNRHWGELVSVVCFKGSLLAAEGSPFGNGLIIKDSRYKYSSRMLFQTCCDSNPWYLNWKLTCVSSSLPNAGKFCLLVLWKSLVLECEWKCASPWWDMGEITGSEWTKHCWSACGWFWTSVILGWACLNVLQLLKLHLCKWFPGLKAPGNMVSVHRCISVCKVWQNWCQAFGNSLFLY